MCSPIKNVLQHKINTQKLKPANCSHMYASHTKQYNLVPVAGKVSVGLTCITDFSGTVLVGYGALYVIFSYCYPVV